jgi:acyl-CoA dehydrogenase
MALLFNEEQQYLKDTAKEFVQKNAPINHFRELRDSEDEIGYSQELWKQMAELGWAGILISEEYGGTDFGMMGLGAILEETGRCLVPSPLFSTALLGVSLVQLAGNPDQKEDLLAKIAKGNLTTSFALEEGPRHLPVSSKIAPKPIIPKSVPPYSSEISMPAHPNSAICFHSS